MTDCAQAEDAVATPKGPVDGGTTGTVEVGPFFQRPDWLSFGITALTAMAIYLWSLAPDVTLENAGGLAPAADYGGVAYPPGFPLWTIYSWVWIKVLPISNVAWRISVGSAFAAAIMCGLVALMVSRGGLILTEGCGLFAGWGQAEQRWLRVVCGWVAGMAVGLSAPIWRKAVIVDVWTFGDLLFTVVLCLLMRWTSRPEQRRFLYWAMLIFGASITENWEFALFFPGILFMVTVFKPELGRDLSIGLFLVGMTRWRFWIAPYVFSSWSVYNNTPPLSVLVGSALMAAATTVYFRNVGSEWKATLTILVMITAGLVLYFWLPVASMMNPPVNWAYPRTLAGFYHSIGRGQYDVLGPANHLDRMVKVLWWQFKDAGGGLGWIYLLLAVVPFVFLWWMNGAVKRWAVSLAGLFMCAGPLMIATLNYSNDKVSLYVVQPYYGAMYVVLAILSGLGMVVLGGVMVRLQANPKKK